MDTLISAFSFFTGDVLYSLRKKGIYTVNDLIRSDNRFIERISSLTYLEICEIKKYITKSFSAAPLNGLKYYQKIKSHSALIPTGIKELDDLLQGGLFTGTIYEICTPPCNEKTLFILKILTNILSENTVFFLDTKQEFSGKLTKTLLSKFKQREECLQLLNKILIKQIFTKYDLISALFEIKQDLEKGIPARIIIIHYLPTLFLNTSNNTENNNIFNHLANVLRYIAHRHNAVIIITNLITTWVDGDFKGSKGLSEKIACGKYWQNIPNVRLKLHKQENNLQITLLKHNTVNINEHCSISINNITV